MGPTRQPERWILHVDMDAFFAAVEILDRPELADRPVIVGGTPEGHGVVSTANYLARRFGIHSAMPAVVAVRRCPHGVFLRPRPQRYSEESRRVFAIFRTVTPLVEPLSIDEAFLDVTGCRPAKVSKASEDDGDRAVALAEEIRARVLAETGGLTCSVGVAENKFLAKVASDLRKPDAVVRVPRGRAAEFLAPLPIERLWGVGPRTAERLHDAGFHTISQLAGAGRERLERLLGTDLAGHLDRLSRGVDDRSVHPSREAKSIGHEVTLRDFIDPGDGDAIDDILFSLAHQVARRLQTSRLWGRTVTLKARDSSFRTVTRGVTLGAPVQAVEELHAIARQLWREKVGLTRPVRLLGVSASHLTDEPLRQLELFDGAETDRRQAERLARIEAEITQRLGDGTITRGRLVRDRRADRPDSHTD